MKLSDIEFAFDFVGDAQPSEHTAFVSRSTGQTFLHTEFGDDVDDLPDDVYDSEKYLDLQELGLLESWHEFEHGRRRERVVEWCREHGLELDDE